MKTSKMENGSVKVACQCCRKKTADFVIRDCGFKTWLACDACKKECEKHPAYRG